MSVDIDTIGHVRVIMINRPERRNALDAATMAGLGDAFGAAEHDDSVRVVVLTAAGDKAFCAGRDLKSEPRAAGATGARGTEVFLDRLFPKPVIGAINGDAVGGGLGIALGCDVLVAAAHARFGLPEVRRGLVGGGSAPRLALRLPPAVALHLGLSGELIDAERAYELGLISRVVPGPDVLPASLDLAETIAGNAPLAVRATKEIMVRTLRILDVPWVEMREIAAPALASEDAREGIAAFRESRAPQWKGR